MIIVLMGYMGCGKSTIGRQLSKILRFDFLDLDDYIESKEQYSVKEIFNNKGEIYFRKKEATYLKEILESKGNKVLALGGGTPCYGNNIDLILNSKISKSFYLKASIPQLISNLKNEKDKRPLISHLNSKEEFAEYLGKHLFERSPFYSKANYTISTDQKSVSEIVEKIVLKLV
ncbi:shikimate kinase [Winogradskyella litorisediminis]|uniref:Shikimate kinase n=1 Tax=Winogradskyella litorisediminis TaxID=1156618 RepID=A0ABW3N7A4_9FLAO